MNNQIFLRRAASVMLKPGEGALPQVQAETLQRELEAFGYSLSPELGERILTLDQKRFASFTRDLMRDICFMRGSHVSWEPLYAGFPEEVVDSSRITLYLNAVAHYATAGSWRPQAKRITRSPLSDDARARLIPLKLGRLDQFESVFTQLASAKSSLSVQDVEDMKWFVRQYGARIYDLIPTRLTHKENLAHLAGALLAQNVQLAVEFLRQHVKSPTDVLRIAVSLNGGDVSLASPAKFASMKRPLRRWMLSVMEASANLEEEVSKRPEVFKRLAERLHPGDFKEKFPNALAAFRNIWEGTRPDTLSKHVELNLEAGRIDVAASLLETRPGEFARRLDHLLRTTSAPQEILIAFSGVSTQVSSSVLTQAHTHFLRRGEGFLRTFFPKGQTALVYAIKDRRQPLSEEITRQAAQICEAALLKSFATRPPLGRCYVAPVLKDFLVPFSQRSAAKALRTVVRGSRLPMPDGSTVRMFLWWKNGRSRTDIDLSAGMFGANYEFMDSLAYYNLKNYGGVHSGDVVDAPHGACEFIDLDIKRLLALNVRFVVASINAYTSQNFCDLPECFAGWMSRSGPGSGEIFEPTTVVDKVDLASASTICLPVIFDLVERQAIWADIALTSYPQWNSLAGNISGVSLMLRALMDMRKPTLHTLFELHAKARGELVATAAEADTVFDLHAGITPFDTDRIRAEFM
ncbi:MAG: hypothetical protein EOO28_32850 [Comamonadaceae bacterium]|nr:MAG: hypothetical protein EOO28_32850 [Comamonadaceae bacterium]